MRLKGVPKIVGHVAVFKREPAPMEILGTFELFPEINAVLTPRLLWSRQAMKDLKRLVRSASRARDKNAKEKS